MIKKSIIICWRGLAEVWHQKKLMVFLISYPILFMLVFGSAFGGEGSPIDVDITMVRPVGGETDMAMDAFIGAFDSVEGINLTLVDNNGGSQIDQSKGLIDDGANIILFLPDGFIGSSDMQIKLDIYYDEAADQNILGVGMGITTGIIEEFSDVMFEQSLAAVKGMGLLSDEELDMINRISSPIAAEYTGISPTGEQDLNYIDYLVPGLVAMSMLWTGVTGASSSIVEDRVRGIRRRILSTPAPRSSIIMGDMLSQLSIVCFQILILLLVATYVYDLHIAGSYPLIAIIVVLGSLSMIGIGILISTFAKTAEEASQVSMLVNFPMMFLAGIFFPLSAGWMQSVSKIFPLTYVNNALRDVMIRGYGLSDVGNELVVSVAFTIAVLGLGIIMLNRGESA